MNLQEAIRRIAPPDGNARAACRARWNRLGKPLYGLGELEEYLVRIAGMMRSERIDIRKRALVIFCADNGVAAEGVSQAPQEVTAVVAGNFLCGHSCAAIMCRRTGTDLFPVDVGMVSDVPGVEKRKCRYGTGNIAAGPAMSDSEALFALEAGIAKAEELRDAGYRILASGEMGIGNTTTGAAVTSAFLHMDAAEAAGRGAGLNDEGLARKTAAIRRALAVNRPDPENPVGVLASVGGFDLAALAGFYIGAAACGLPAVVDGFIASAAALAAVRLAPLTAEYLLPSHVSGEPASEALLCALGFGPGPGRISPVIRAGMHLGEGTGALALFPLLDLACDVYREMATFEEIAVEAYEDFTKR